MAEEAKARELGHRLEKCWAISMDWSTIPKGLKEVQILNNYPSNFK